MLDSCGLDILRTEKRGRIFEFRTTINVSLFNVDATNGFRMWSDLIMNILFIAGAKTNCAYNNISVGSDIIACY